MIRIAIVDDESSARRHLQSMVSSYYNNDETRFNVTLFNNAAAFLDNYKPVFDLVFMDIELGGEDGMTAAAELRKLDSIVMIVFVTNMAQFAVKGYDVRAFDFIVKPLSFSVFSQKMARIEGVLDERKGVEVLIPQKYSTARVNSSEIIYIEISGHYLDWHTTSGVLHSYGKMTDVEEMLKQANFLRCNKGYLINPRYVKNISKQSVTMKGGDELLIARARKKQFMQDFGEWIGDGKNL